MSKTETTNQKPVTNQKPMTNTYQDILEESWLLHTIHFATERLKYLRENSEALNAKN